MVHGVTTEECQEALQNHSWSVQRAAQYLKVLLHPAFSGFEGSLDPSPTSCLRDVSMFPMHLTAWPCCPSGGATLWAGSSATRRVS